MSKSAQTQVQNTSQSSLTPAPSGLLQRKCAKCEEEEATLQRKSSNKSQATPPVLHEVLRSSSVIQPKLKIGQPNDKYEQEADRVAEQVMRMPESKMRSQINRKDKPENLLQTKPLIQRRVTDTNSVNEAPSIVNEVLRSPGQPLDRNTRSFMESRFGHDFSQVRIHTDAKAAKSARKVDARAYTVGQDVIFGHGEYTPSNSKGQHLLAHELTHAIQQSSSHGKNSIPNQTSLVLQNSKHPQVMREQLFASTLKIQHQYLRSRTFRITQGGLKVTVNANWGPEEEHDPMPVGCREDFPFSIQLREDGFILNDPWGTCDFTAGQPSSRQWIDLPSDDYFLAINTPDTGPYCFLQGDILVSQERGLSGDNCTQPPPGPLEILHSALAGAGLIPALGVIPDAIDAAIYVIEGDWASAGLSAAAIIPIFGQGVTVTRQTAKVTGEAVERLGRDGIESGLRRARTRGRTVSEVGEGVSPSARRVDPDVDEAVERAFNDLEVPEVRGGRRPRIDDRAVPRTQRRRLDIEDIPRRTGETARQAVARIHQVIGHRISDIPNVRSAWNRARERVLQNETLTNSNYEVLYNKTRQRFWQEIRGDSTARRYFNDAGFEFPSGRGTAPVLSGVDSSIPIAETRISLDHIAEKAIGDNWRRALDADNLQMEFQMPNTYREIIQSRHPSLRE